MVVVTPKVQSLFGTSLATNWAPAVLRTFGTGTGAISVRIMAPMGAVNYDAQLSTDLRQRRSGGTVLLESRRVTASATARTQLLTGQVDTRLIVVLTGLAALKPIDILGFGTTYPGTSPHLPLRTADLAGETAAARMSQSDYVSFLRNELNKQQGVWKPFSTRTSRDSAGKMILQVTFAAPSPLLLFAGQGQ